MVTASFRYTADDVDAAIAFLRGRFRSRARPLPAMPTFTRPGFRRLLHTKVDGRPPCRRKGAT